MTDDAHSHSSFIPCFKIFTHTGILCLFLFYFNVQTTFTYTNITSHTYFIIYCNSNGFIEACVKAIPVISNFSFYSFLPNKDSSNPYSFFMFLYPYSTVQINCMYVNAHAVYFIETKHAKYNAFIVLDMVTALKTPEGCRTLRNTTYTT